MLQWDHLWIESLNESISKKNFAGDDGITEILPKYSVAVSDGDEIRKISCSAVEHFRLVIKAWIMSTYFDGTFRSVFSNSRCPNTC